MLFKIFPFPLKAAAYTIGVTVHTPSYPSLTSFPVSYQQIGRQVKNAKKLATQLVRRAFSAQKLLFCPLAVAETGTEVGLWPRHTNTRRPRPSALCYRSKVLPGQAEPTPEGKQSGSDHCADTIIEPLVQKQLTMLQHPGLPATL